MEYLKVQIISYPEEKFILRVLKRHLFYEKIYIHQLRVGGFMMRFTSSFLGGLSSYFTSLFLWPIFVILFQK